MNEEGSKIVFSTYQSSPLVEEAQKESTIPPFDLVVADEAHRCAGKVSAAFGCVLDEQRIRAKKRLFFTATPRVLSNQIKGQAEAKDIEVASMDDTSIFGEVLYQIKFSHAIDRDLLSTDGENVWDINPYVCHGFVIDLIDRLLREIV